jgi:hypothetical protein
MAWLAVVAHCRVVENQKDKTVTETKSTVLRTTQSLATVGACSVSLTFEPFGDASLAELVPALAGKPHRFDHDLLTDRTFRALDWLQFRGEELLFRGEGLESHLCELREE